MSQRNIISTIKNLWNRYTVKKKVYMQEKLMILNRNQRQWMSWYGCINEVYARLFQGMGINGKRYNP